MVAFCFRKTFQSHPIGRRDSRENKSGVPSDVVSRRRTAPYAPDGTRTRTPNRAWDAANYITGAARRAGVGPAPMVLETMILPLDHRHIGGMSYGMPLRAVYGSRTRVCGLGSRRTDRCTNTARNRGRRAKGDQKRFAGPAACLGWDSNPRPSAPEADALSTGRPRLVHAGMRPACRALAGSPFPLESGDSPAIVPGRRNDEQRPGGVHALTPLYASRTA